jgi:prepilin-type N-terminal cleavage/methylation domain-containing protein
MKSRLRKGFTLIELLVVISIIGVLASIILASLASVRPVADDATKQITVQQFIDAIQLYYDTHGYYPTPAIHPSNDLEEQTITYNFYSMCLQNTAAGLCTFYNAVSGSTAINDPTFYAALTNFMHTPVATGLPVMVSFPRAAAAGGESTFDIGGIEYDCTPTAPGAAHSNTDPNAPCQSYMLNWIYHSNTPQCVGGYIQMAPSNAIGYETTNRECSYTNNVEFMTDFWADNDVVSPLLSPAIPPTGPPIHNKTFGDPDTSS